MVVARIVSTATTTMKNLIAVCSLATCAAWSGTAFAQNRIIIRDGDTKSKEVSIDPLFEAGKLWNETATSIESSWKDKGFKWNSEQMKDRGVIRRENWGFQPLALKAFGSLTVEEVVFIFKAGKLTEVALLPWNKGDSKESDITEKTFMAIVDSWTVELNKCVAPNYQDRGRDTASAARAERRMWMGKETLAQLEYSGGKERIRDPYSGRERSGPNFQGEFIRLRLLPKPDSMIGLDASTGGKVAVRRADLAKSVVRDPSGDVLIPNVPMVDQGDKGYCAVATSARVLNYYGVPADQHEMAQVSGNEAGGGGTNPDEMEDAMKKLSGKYKTRFTTVLDLDYSSRKYQSFLRKYNTVAKKLDKKVLDTDNYIYFFGGLDPEVLREVNGKGQTYERFMKAVKENIDKGVPVMWALQLGLFPENGEKARQSGGGHMRLIIGYNPAKDEIIFSDSWGAGHEKKRMAAPDASAATMGLYLLQPSM
jgi:Peptidase_C39 like family